MESFDVAVVGAGPAGSSTAIFLARRGYSVALLDKETFPREKLCGDFVNPANWPILRELDVEEAILSRLHERVKKFRLTSFSGEEAEVPLLVDQDTSPGLGLRRLDFDHVLFEKAKSGGVVSRQGFRIKELNRTNQGWYLAVDDSQFIEQISAKVVVGADGRNSWVARRLRLTGRAEREGRAIGFQVRLRGANLTRGKIEIHLFPGGYAGIVGVGDRTATLGFAIDKVRFRNRQSLDQLLDTTLSVNPALKEIICRSEVIGEARSTYPVYFPPRRSWGDRALLVGDAARVNEPVSGEGIYFAMKSGELAAKALDEAFRAGDFSAARLRSYQRYCQSAFRLRRGINAIMRWFIYRPAMLAPLIRLSRKRTGLLDSIVHTICTPETTGEKALG